MRLSLREKQSLYDHLAKLLRAGVPFPAAVDKLLLTSSGGMRQLLRAVRAGVERGRTVGEAFEALRPAVSEMESAAISALDRTGRMEHGLQQLSEYFGALGRARSEMISRSAYPLFVLHFGLLALNLPLIVSGGLDAYFGHTVLLFGGLYGVAAAVGVAAWALRDAGAANPAMDRLLRRLPLLGKIRRAFSMARFFAAYDMQLDAGVNVIDSLQAAARASRSGLIAAAVGRAVPEVRNGAQVGPLLAASGAFPEEAMRAFLVAEESGQLDRELPEMAAGFQAEALQRLGTLSEWVPRLLYVGILVYLGWRIVAGYQSYLGEITRQIDSI